jgi:nitrate reductase gamma subunit
MENKFANLEDQPENPESISPEDARKQKAAIIGASIAVLIVLAAVIAFAVFLLTGSNETTERIRDVFIIFMALESMVIGLVLIILQNEIKPILDSTNETVSTLRGTTQFLGDHLAEPVIKLNEYLAGLSSFLKIIRPARKK